MDLKACLSLENKESGQNVGSRKQKIMCLMTKNKWLSLPPLNQEKVTQSSNLQDIQV
jgi:hypothetical protein